MHKKVNNGGDNVEREEISAGNQGKVKELVLFSLFTALTAIGAFIRVPVPLCPFTLQLLFTTLSGLILGSRKGAASVAVYVALGLSGVPVLRRAEGRDIFSSLLSVIFWGSSRAPGLRGNCRSIWKNCHLSAFYLRTWQDFLWSTFWNGLCIHHK